AVLKQPLVDSGRWTVKTAEHRIPRVEIRGVSAFWFELPTVHYPLPTAGTAYPPGTASPTGHVFPRRASPPQNPTAPAELAQVAFVAPFVRWQIPVLLRGRVFTHGFTFPVRALRID